MKAHSESRAECNAWAQNPCERGWEVQIPPRLHLRTLPSWGSHGLEVLTAELGFGKNRSCHSAWGLAPKRSQSVRAVSAPCGFLADQLLCSLPFLKASFWLWAMDADCWSWPAMGTECWGVEASVCWNENRLVKALGNWNHLSLFSHILHRTGVCSLFS